MDKVVCEFTYDELQRIQRLLELSILDKKRIARRFEGYHSSEFYKDIEFEENILNYILERKNKK